MHIREGTDLCHRRMRDSSFQVQPDDALFNPLKAVEEVQKTPSQRRTAVVNPPGSQESELLPAECDRFQADIAVWAIGALGGDEERRLLGHVDGCAHCAAQRKELSEVVKALETITTLSPVLSWTGKVNGGTATATIDAATSSTFWVSNKGSALDMFNDGTPKI
jgi:hypothetical protein